MEAKLLNSESVLNTNTDVPISERVDAKREFEKFVMDTYKELVMCERRKMGGSSSLEVFCRIDVGLFLKDDGDLGYFVNEVERTLTCGFWTRNVEVDFKVFAGTFARSLAGWSDNLP